MKTTSPTLLAALALITGSAAHAQIAIGNVRAAQRPGTKLVDIDYDLTGIATPCKVWLEISADGGGTWLVPATAATGALGASVSPGNDLRITWDAGVDWNGLHTPQTRFRIKASDLLPPVLGFASIPGGNFQMGDNLDGLSNAPVHVVNVSAFYMGEKEVTKAQWDAVRIWALLNGYTDLPAGEGKAADHPVQNVSWYNVAKWCNALSEQEGKMPCYYTDYEQATVYRTGDQDIFNDMVKWTANGYRLPTEAEWEKATRGGLVGQRFPWGDTISHSQANYYSDSSYSYDVGPTREYHPTYNDGIAPYSSPVGSFAANGYGVFDMAGNVREWCWDFYEADYASSVGTDPKGPNGNVRVIRGGSWQHSAQMLGCSTRSAQWPFGGGNNMGFRLVRR
jgi:formylglycine-generating enzyme required for sulfatase activity